MKFSHRVMMLSSIGFGIGVIVGVIISAALSTLAYSDGTLYLCSKELLEMIGDPLAAFIVQAVTCGLMGAFATGASAVYSIEEWGVMKCTVIHYISVMAVYCIVGFAMHWFTMDNILDLLIMLAIMTVVYFFIWLSNYLSYRAELKQINLELDRLKSLDFHMAKCAGQ